MYVCMYVFWSELIHLYLEAIRFTGNIYYYTFIHGMATGCFDVDGGALQCIRNQGST